MGGGRSASAFPPRRFASIRFACTWKPDPRHSPTIYQAALRSDRVAFVLPGSTDPVDVVLVDSTSVGEVPLMSRLRTRFPGALFVSLGLPQTPGFL